MRDWVALPSRATAIRVDEGRAYVVGQEPDGTSDVVVELADALAVGSAHDVRAWVLRRDEGQVRVRQTGGCGVGKAEVAWVQR